ncbi:MAG: hypothetical protein RJA36_1494 [Pseudomonadota bacterium]|jgi:hypothetical protein
MDWYRRYHGTCADPKLRLVARSAQVPTPFAIAAWDACLEYASDRDDRGSMAGYSAELLAVTIDVTESDAERLLQAFRARGMILPDDRIKAWGKRQPSDATAAERMRRYRARKAEKSSNSNEDGPPDDAERERATAAPRPAKRNKRNAAVTDRNALPQNRTDSESEKKDSESPAALSETPTPREDGADAPGRGQEIAGGVSTELIDGLMPFYELRNSRRGVERLVELLVLQCGSAAKVEGRLLEAIGRRMRDPIQYVRRVIESGEINRFAAVESAKHLATMEKPSVLEGALEIFNQTLATMDGNDGNGTGGPGLPH